MSEKWYTYPAAAEALGVKVQAVQKRARRNGWGKRVNNETGLTEVQFDLEAVGRRAVHQVVRTSSDTSTYDIALIDENMPVVFIGTKAPPPHLINNLGE